MTGTPDIRSRLLITYQSSLSPPLQVTTFSHTVSIEVSPSLTIVDTAPLKGNKMTSPHSRTTKPNILPKRARGPPSPNLSRYTPQLPTITEMAEAPENSQQPPASAPSPMLPKLDHHIRLEDQAAALRELMHGRIFHAPLTHPNLILDIDCGTGIITRELGRMFPFATVYGIDETRAPFAYADSTPANVTFIQGSFDEVYRTDERLKDGTFDFVFCRLLIFRMARWERFICDVTCLLNTDGWFEVQDTGFSVYKEHPELGQVEVSRGWKFMDVAINGAKQLGLDPECGDHAERTMMFTAGLVDVEPFEYIMPLHEGYADRGHPEARRIGRHMMRWQWMVYRQVLPLLLRTGRRSWERRQFNEYMEEARRCCEEGGEEMKDLYRILYVTVGRKPIRRVY